METKIVIAIFENDSLNRFIYQRMLDLQKEKVTSYIFNSVEEGLEMSKNVSFDVVFIDLHLRGEQYSGIELAKTLKAISDNSVMVGMTTLIQKGDVERTTEAGFAACHEKPLPFFDLDKLLAGIR
jgi:CheY-like chemotaxis protein